MRREAHWKLSTKKVKDWKWNKRKMCWTNEIGNSKNKRQTEATHTSVSCMCVRAPNLRAKDHAQKTLSMPIELCHLFFNRRFSVSAHPHCVLAEHWIDHSAPSHNEHGEKREINTATWKTNSTKSTNTRNKPERQSGITDFDYVAVTTSDIIFNIVPAVAQLHCTFQPRSDSFI